MTDFFALLNEPRRPWLEPEPLKQKFLALSATVHPDRIHSASETDKAIAAKQFAEGNAAFQCLSHPKSRLLHLLELERGTKPNEIQSIPVALADLFVEVATACKKTDGFLIERSKNLSPLVAVRSFERSQEELEQLEAIQSRLRDLRRGLEDRLKILDAAWMKMETGKRSALLPELEELYRLFSYLNRWDGQIQERRIQLAL